MDTISKDKGRIWDSLQFKFGLSYILIIAGVLMLLNTYPLRVSQDLVFRSKATTLQSSVSVMVYSLSGLDRLTEENVSQAMAVVEETGLSRILVTDSAGKVLYDTRETNDALGEYSFYTEIVQALLGNDVFSSSYRDGAFRSRAASPVLYQNQIIGAVYAYEYDTEQAALLEGLQGNLLRLSAGIAVVVLCLSGLLSRALTRKIGQLLTAIREVREGAYSHRAEVPGRDEIAQLAQEFNSLTDRLQTTENARRRFVSDASHELKTPLAAIRLLTDSILQTENIDRETAREFVTDIGQEAERLSRITEDLLRLTGAVDLPSNGVTLCTGSLGSSRANDVVKIADRLCAEGKIPFVHGRNVRWEGEEDFCESGHLTASGSLNMAAILAALHRRGFDGVIRADHGRMVWGERGRPGYGLYDRAMGVCYLAGLWEALCYSC